MERDRQTLGCGGKARPEGVGEMAGRIRDFDWRLSPLGAIEGWPQSLHTAVQIMLAARHPVWIGWGPDLVCLYNDPHRSLLGGRHPFALGQSASQVWPEIWHIIGPLLSTAVRTREGIHLAAQPLILERHGYPEETHHTLSYSPIPDDNGEIGGVFCAASDDTQQVIDARQQALLHGLTAALAEARTFQDACERAARSLLANSHDLPFVMIYRSDPGTGALSLVAATGIEAGHPAAPAVVGPSDPSPWPFARLLKMPPVTVLDDLSHRFTGLPTGAWELPPLRAAVTPIPDFGEAGRTGLLIIGINPFREFDGGYRDFLTLLTGQLAAGAARAARVEVAEQERAQIEAQRDRALAAVRAEQARLYDLLMHAPAIICVLRGPAHVFELANERYLQTIGRADPDAILGKPVREALPEIEGQGFFEILDRTYATGEPYIGYELPVKLDRRGDGVLEEILVNFVYQPTRDASGDVDGILVHAVEVTQQVHARRQVEELAGRIVEERDRLHESEERLRAVFESSLVGFALLGPDLSFTRVNDAFCAMVGYARLELHQMQWASLVHPDDSASTARIASLLTDGSRPSVAVEQRFLRKDGPPIRVQASVSLTRVGAGLAMHLTAVCQDMTEICAAEEALRDADQRKDEFLAMLAHELRNPLAPIRTAAQLLQKQSGSPPPANRQLQIIERQIGNMARLLDDLLDVSRITRGLIRLDRERVNLSDVVAETVEAAGALFEERGHEITVSLAPDLFVNADRLRLEQVITNLVTNAAKYTDSRGKIRGKIRIETSRDGQDGMLVVTDNGIGIPPELLPHVFDLFAQGDRTIDRSQGGLGIGLRIVRTLVELHGGNVTARSDGPGRGSTFVVRLPLIDLPLIALDPIEESRRLPETEQLERHTASLSNRKVLIVDDDPVAAEALGELVKRCGCVARIAHDGPSALRLARQFRPRVVLLDIGMPSMEGCEIAVRFRQDTDLAAAQLVALTGGARKAEPGANQGCDAAFVRQLSKPVAPDEAERLLNEIFSPEDRPSQNETTME